MPATGQCECGSFIYTLDSEPKTIVICHCKHCQRQSGSAFGMSMVLTANQFNILKGTLSSFSRATDAGGTMLCYFCPDCGTRIYHQKEGEEGIVILKPGTLDDADANCPDRQLWTSVKQDWISLPDVEALEKQ
jgi:hypothetical protein